MKECKFYEVDSEAKAENDSWWADMPEHMKRQIAEFDEAMGANNAPSPPEDEMPCNEFCKYYAEASGFPGETLRCCWHPENKKILGASSVFDGITDHDQRMRILDELV